jgi:predicted NBD/HSP70 family sugar kinase
MTLAGATQDEVRRHNLASLVRLLHEHGALTRAQLTLRTGLNRSTVGGLTTELAEVGIVEEGLPEGSHRAGRPSIVVWPLSEQNYVLAMDVGAEHVIAARVGLGGEVLDRRELHHDREEGTVDLIVERLHDLGQAVMATGPTGARLVGIGVSVCGVVRRSDGLVRFAPNLGWVDVPLGRLVADRFGTALSVRVGNDADLGAVAERVRGAALGSKNLVYLSCEVGVGGGIIVDERLLSGAGGYAGEVGHLVVNPGGRRCRCGAQGCWETEVGEEALLLATGKPAGTDVDEIIDAFNAGDPQVRAGVRRVGHWLGVGLANIVNIFNPEVVVVGGLLRGLIPLVRPDIEAALGVALAAPREQVRLEMPLLSGDSPLLGAAEMAFESLLDDPLGTVARADRGGRG